VSTGDSNRAIFAALFANLGIALTKFVAYVLTGSSSMLAESIHSLADTGNQGLLLIGGRRAKKGATEQHPFGYGRERYLYAFLVAIVLFSLGGLFALYEGYHKVSEREGIHSWRWVPVTVLVVALVLESFSLRTAVVESNRARGTAGWVTFIRHSKAPELPVVLLEDCAALLGLMFALIGVSLTLITGDGIWDGLGTIAIGLLLVAVAVVLGIETKSLLLGEGANPEAVARIRAALEDDDLVERVIHMRTMHLGPEELLVAAKIAVPPGTSAEDVAAAINAAERRVRDAEPVARVIYLEPDIDASRPEASTESPAAASSG
jgi:cation diffusion facilitator family transporter